MLGRALSLSESQLCFGWLKAEPAGWGRETQSAFPTLPRSAGEAGAEEEEETEETT